MRHLYLTRLIVENVTPLAINTGRRETGFDTQLVRDANQLPYIPATAFAGVWRSLVTRTLDDNVAARWFGPLQPEQNSRLWVPDHRSDSLQSEPSSRLWVQNGLLLDSRSKPVIGLLDTARLNDPLLQQVMQERPHHRERVRLNDRGVASDQGKFDQILLPRGLRFCVDIRWQTDAPGEQDLAEWQQLLQTLQDRRFALGASTRNGLGQMTIIASEQRTIDLKGSDPERTGTALRDWMLRKQLPRKRDLPAVRPTPFARLALQALDSWRAGQGAEALFAPADDHTDSFTYSEPRILWLDNGQAQLNAKARPVLCGSTIKGILAHRLAYHYRRQTGQYAEDMAEESHAAWQQRPIELKGLLGHADETEHAASVAGRLLVADVDITCSKSIIRTHNAVDRFTGGVRQGALYSEELLWQPRFELELWLAPHTTVSPELKVALEETLEDLRLGLLPFGAGSGRGNSLVEPVKQGVWTIDWSQLHVQATQEQ